MDTIYKYNNDFDKSAIYEKMSLIDDRLREERSKTDGQKNDKEEFDLIYALFIQGLKLSTGSFLY